MAEIKRYGVRIEMAEPDPDKRVSYVYDAVGMAPARMDFERGAFDYGDWAGVWFVAGNYPCMVGYDGAEAYRLDPADYSLRAGGGASQVADPAFPGNAMAALPCVWLACWEEGGYQYLVAADGPYDERYRAFAHTRADGTVADVAYYPLFKGSLVDGRLRSIAGLHLAAENTAAAEIAAAQANGVGWTTLSWSQVNLLSALCTIISCCDDGQAAFGYGHCDGGSGSSVPLPQFPAGTLMDRGQFFGCADMFSAVKVFHVENYWGDRFDRLQGLIIDHGVVKAKMTPPYSLDDFTDYATVGISLKPNTGSYVGVSFASEYGRLPVAGCTEEHRFQCDGFNIGDQSLGIALFGGTTNDYSHAGPWFLMLKHPQTQARWHIGASPSLLAR